MFPIFLLIANTGDSLAFFCSLEMPSEMVSIDPVSDFRLSASFLSLALPLPRVQERRLPGKVGDSASPACRSFRSVVGVFLKR